jgi:hypothetical protein
MFTVSRNAEAHWLERRALRIGGNVENPPR